MRELAEAARQGLRGAVVFVIQRPDAFAFAPNVAMDPAFADALQEAAGVGAKVIAVKCDVTESTIRMVDQVEVRLRPHDG
jgi:sugar fermentation stimulation protein A